MHTEILTIDPQCPDPDAIARAAEVLRRGGLVAFPTETVYGLGANALDAEAVAGIFRAKDRPANNPLIVHLADATAAPTVAAQWPDLAAKLTHQFWPGPLTLVLPRTPAVPDVVTGGGPTVAVRVPGHPTAKALLAAAGVPIAAPSANRSGLLSPTRAEHVLRGLEGRIDLLLDAGPTPGGLESTVLDLTVLPPRLLRPGLVSRSELEAVLGPLERCRADFLPEDTTLPSPGMQSRHYAPRTPLECVATQGRARVEELLQAGLRVGWLRRGSVSMPKTGVICESLAEDPEGYAAELYAALHRLDQRGLDRIIVDLPPDSDAWAAVRDRLRRASI
jgi:L-threonylcarbamoyladenylate synthase